MCVKEDIETPVDGRHESYLCKTCLAHMKAGRIPPMSIRNKLHLHDQDEDLKLTELEGAMIAKNLIFEKIFQLPKSRWTALTDKIINVPVNDEDILNTVNLLPRNTKGGQIDWSIIKKKIRI